MSEYSSEPVRGLPGHLPPGEHIIWQGSPSWRPLARRVFHTHLVAGYFAVLTLWTLLNVASGHATLTGSLRGIGITLGVGAAAVGLLALFGWLTARATIYTITSRRVVLRFGVALPKCVNVPFTQIAAAGLQVHADGSGDLPLTVKQTRLGYIHLWPNVRPWRLGSPEPMLRAVADPQAVARTLASALAAAVPGRREALAEPGAEAGTEPVAAPVFVPGGQVAA